jgi:hypothetical protein
MEWYESEVAALEQRQARGDVPDAPVLFYSSSSIREWQTLPASDLLTSYTAGHVAWRWRAARGHGMHAAVDGSGA